MLYNEQVISGLVAGDSAQRDMLNHLDRLFFRLLDEESKARAWTPPTSTVALPPTNSSSWLKSLFSPPPPPKVVPPTTDSKIRGLYIHAGPGAGKTFLMDLFFHALPFKEKKRLHFHEFLMQTHRVLHDLHKRNITGDEKLLACMTQIRSQAFVLCFDEFQITDIADATIIRSLFSLLFDNGLVMVSTSNRAPEELYKNGLQRKEVFLPFLEDLKANCRILPMSSTVDYRVLAAVKEKTTDSSNRSLFLVVDNKSIKSYAKFERLWEDTTKGDVLMNLALKVQGRILSIPQAGRHADVCRFTFQDLCGAPLGALDYYCLADTFHTVFLEDIPRLCLHKGEANKLRRLITLIDTLYDQNVILIATSLVQMEDILDASQADSANQEIDLLGSISMPNTSDEVFAFSRTLSRLQEMQTQTYLEKVARERKRSHQGSPFRFFSQFEREHNVLSLGDARQIFDRYDVNQDNVLDVHTEFPLFLEEIQLFFQGHRHVPETAFSHVVRELDPNKSGKIAWDKFLVYLQTHGLEVIR